MFIYYFIAKVLSKESLYCLSFMQGNHSGVYHRGKNNVSINFVKHKHQKVRIKSKSCYCINIGAQKQKNKHINNSQASKIAKQYSRLTTRSLQVNYKISNLQPYSPNISIAALNKQLQWIDANDTKSAYRSNYYQQKASIKDKLKQFIHNSKHRQTKIDNKQFIATKLQDQYISLIQNYEKIDTDNSHWKNFKIVKNQHLDLKLSISSSKKIGLKQTRQLYQDDPVALDTKDRRVRTEYDTRDYIATSRTHRKLLSGSKRTQKNIYNSRVVNKNNKDKISNENNASFQDVFYRQYMKSYTQRKLVLGTSKLMMQGSCHTHK